MSAWRRKFSLIILWIPVNCPAIVIMLASDSMIAVLTTNTFVQVKVFSYLFFLDYLLMNTADHKLIKEEFFYYCLDKGQLISKGHFGILNSSKNAIGLRAAFGNF